MQKKQLMELYCHFCWICSMLQTNIKIKMNAKLYTYVNMHPNNIHKMIIWMHHYYIKVDTLLLIFSAFFFSFSFACHFLSFVHFICTYRHALLKNELLTIQKWWWRKKNDIWIMTQWQMQKKAKIRERGRQYCGDKVKLKKPINS